MFDHSIPCIQSKIIWLSRLSSKTDEQLKKTDEQLKETDEQLKDLGRQMAEASAESKRESAELRKQMAEEWAEIRQQSGEVDRRFGNLAEAMTLGDVLDLLNSHPQINVHSLRHNDRGVHRSNNYEIDAFAFGDDCVVVLEAKATLRSGHVSNFIYESINLKNFFDIHDNHRGKRLYGAVAYLKIDDKARELADKKGLLIIRSTYSNKTLVNPQTKLRDYTPKQD